MELFFGLLDGCSEVGVGVVNNSRGLDTESVESTDEVFTDGFWCVGFVEFTLDFNERAKVFDFVDTDINSALHS